MSESSLAASGGRVPLEHKDLEQVFTRHYEYYRGEDGEIAHQQQSGESAIRRAYSGRMVFELLQNAIDRAEDRVEVLFRATDDEQSAYQLVVANDGTPVRVDPRYPYDNPPDANDSGAQRPDFNALCSLHTSNKSQDESIGTKGSGFRSVFSIETHVRIWSKVNDSADWWGLEMHSPMERATWTDRKGDPDVRRGIDAYLSDTELPPMGEREERPSYHFPLPLSADKPLSMLTDGESLSTGVVVPVPEEDKSNLKSSFDQLESHHLYFTGLAEGNEDITVEFNVLGERTTHETDPSHLEAAPEDEATWSISHWSVDDPSSELADQADKADLDITYPGAAIAWPPRHPNHALDEDEGEDVKPAMYGYLPTIIDGPFGADLHGDFKLSIDRTNIRFDDDIIGPYNTRIAQIGAELHVLTAVRGTPELIEAIDWKFIDPEEVAHSAAAANFDRRDFWRFLNPDNATSKTDIVEKHVADLLFDPNYGRKDSERYTLWAKLAYEFFEQRDEWPVETYDSFWEANLQWVDRIYDGKTRRKNWRRIAKAMCDAFRESDAAVAPIVEGDDARVAEAKSLPPSRSSARAGGSSERKEKELYIWNPNREEFELSKLFDLPGLLKDDNRIVTTYDFDNNLYKYSPKPLGATPFTRWEVLNELRQLPNTLKRVGEHESRELAVGDDDDVVTRQCQLIRFAAQLYQLDTGGSQETPADSDQYDLGWRMRDEFSRDSQRAGRSLATLFLPVTNGEDDAAQLWAPARQLTRDQVAIDRIGTLPDGIDVDAFLAFLGVAPTPPDGGVPLTLVEGGADGRVEPRETPPPLAAAESASPDATLAELRPANRPVSDPQAWHRSIQVAYDEWLEPLLSHEHEVAALEEDDSETSEVSCWTNLVDTLGNWPWYPVGDAEEPGVAIPPEVGHDDVSVAHPREITVHSSRQTQFPKLLYGVEESADSAQLLVALGAVDGLDPEDLRADTAEQAYRLLRSVTNIAPVEIETPRLRLTLVDLYNRLLEAIVRGDEEARNSDQLSLLVYESGEEGMALSERQLTWSRSFEEVWIAKDRSEQQTIHQYFPTIPLVAATVAPRHTETYTPLTEQPITLTETVRTDPSEGISDEITDDLFNRLSDLVPRLLALADASSQSNIDRSSLTDDWSPDRFRCAEKVWREVTVEFDDQRRTRRDLEESQGIVLVTSEEPRHIVFDAPTDAERPALTEFGEALAEFLLDDSFSDLFARALRMAEEGQGRLDTFLEDRGAKSLVPTYQNEFDPLSSEEHAILVDEIESALDTVDLSLETTAASQLRIIRPEDISVTDSPRDGPGDALTQTEVKEALETIELPDSRDWEGYRPQFRCVDAHYNNWERWFDQRETYLVPYLLEFLEERVSPEYSEDSLKEALDNHARKEVCPRITFQPEQVIPSWLAAQGVEDIPSCDDLLDQAKRYQSSFESVTDVKTMAEVGIEPGEIQDVTIDPEGDGGTITPEEATRTKRAQMAYGENAEQAALDRIAGTTREALKNVREEDGVRTVFGDTIHDLQDAVDVLCWPFYDGGVTDTHVREHIDAYKSDADTTALRTALHVSTVWDGAGFDIIGLDYDDGVLYPVRYEIKSLSDTGSSTIAHLSQKQYAVYKAVHDPDSTDHSVAGDWRLYGVTEEGVAIDITDWLDNLPDGALASLREEGIEPDGLVLSTKGTDVSESK